MNELGVDFEVIGEKATRYAENGDPVYWITMQTKTYNGDKLMFLYEADLTIRWLNLDNDDETIEPPSTPSAGTMTPPRPRAQHTPTP